MSLEVTVESGYVLSRKRLGGGVLARHQRRHRRRDATGLRPARGHRSSRAASPGWAASRRTPTSSPRSAVWVGSSPSRARAPPPSCSSSARVAPCSGQETPAEARARSSTSWAPLTSHGTSQPGTIHSDSDGLGCSGGSNDNVFIGAQNAGIAAYAAPLVSNPTQPDPNETRVHHLGGRRQRRGSQRHPGQPRLRLRQHRTVQRRDQAGGERSHADRARARRPALLRRRSRPRSRRSLWHLRRRAPRALRRDGRR